MNLQSLWRTQWVAAMADHMGRVLTPLLPSDREIVATGLQLAIMRRRDGEPLSVASTYTIPTPSDEAVLDAGVVDDLLSDLQDEIAIHLARAWPEGPTGMALHARARQAGDVIELAFVASSGRDEDGITLPPFVPPPPLDQARVAG